MGLLVERGNRVRMRDWIGGSTYEGCVLVKIDPVFGGLSFLFWFLPLFCTFQIWFLRIGFGEFLGNNFILMEQISIKREFLKVKWL